MTSPITQALPNSVFNSGANAGIDPVGSCHAMVFDVRLGAKSYLFALPLTAIAKIIARSSALVRSADHADFLYLGEQLVTILNLERILDASGKVGTHRRSSTILDAAAAPAFLIIAQTQPDNLCAIPVHTPPTLMALDLQNLRSLPTHTVQAMGNIANHVATLPDDGATGSAIAGPATARPTTAGKTLPIFLLNLQQALTVLKVQQVKGRQRKVR